MPRNIDPPNGDQQQRSDNSERETELAHIRDALNGLRFGAVNIVVQDGVVVQIDRTEKRRLRTKKE